ncbi:MAG: 3',5'-cyclic adenosine monophosphate phosphodiesterase CpdA [Candidatus Moanabacter tarae]|uniref:3',5'-cyclic adenosine monophosphate phosphodiesterase CpdA n=1 Tax=Candidatus Moanibacter tarae TaxID=2200854 RepID=A0A2Z4AF99_9BACT|nr:MAG: 3',5'-cyclic adenosine monophosphate phosphodiesterase CpdA [Candidatus Moanabacter tarae]|tara:strand:+ start:352 stop:2418 length:2067 start_codon:yes stop_codon:yes gene_type:complete
MSHYYDRTQLLPAEFEFVVLADTHYTRISPDTRVEFEGRRKQLTRIAHVLNLINSLNPEFVIHLGDLTQEAPGSENFEISRQEALDQIERVDSKWHQVAGNHEVGDKPDATMPTHPVSRRILAAYHENMRSSWYSFNHGKCSFIILNSQIFNTGIPEENEQCFWLENLLVQLEGQRLFVFMHLPLFILERTESYTGHYDNIGEPARSWLIELFQKHSVELVINGHVHFQFLNYIGQIRLLTLGSTSFTRPGFAHLFTSASPPENAREDVAKLGFYLFRVLRNKVDVHFLRTGGDCKDLKILCKNQRLITLLANNLEDSPLGLTLRNPITNVSQIPIAYPSTIRQDVRNDYPLLSCFEIGVKALRVPLKDIRDNEQWTRLSLLHDQGIAICVFLFESEIHKLPTIIEEFMDTVSNWEIQLPGSIFPLAETIELLKDLQNKVKIEVSLCPVIPDQVIPGKQLPRTRFGYRLKELENIKSQLDKINLQIMNICCRIGLDENPWDVIRLAYRLKNLGKARKLYFLIELGYQDDNRNSCRAVEALFAAALFRGTRIFFDPLIDIDRTMDVSLGILDTLCNPRPVFHAIRCLNTILYGLLQWEIKEENEIQWDGVKELQFINNGRKLSLLLPGSPKDENRDPPLKATSLLLKEQSFTLYLLNQGIVLHEANEGHFIEMVAKVRNGEPCLIDIKS